MSQSALQELSNYDFLSNIWRTMYISTSRTARQSKGHDGISLIHFENNKKFYLKELARELRTGRYQPQPLTPHFIPKADGKDRVICVPAVCDRLAQRALGDFLHQKNYQFHNRISYGFVKGKSVQKAANAAIEYRNQHPWVYKADISAFFDRIDRAILIEKIQSNIRLRSLHPLLIKIVNTEIAVRDSYTEKRIKNLGIKQGEGLRQGMPISPYLANLMLKNFDASLQNQRVKAIRYADDLIVLCDNRQECEATHRLSVSLLDKENLSIHPLEDQTKTTIASPEEMVEFLGLGLSPSEDKYHLIVTDNQLASIKGKLLAMSDINTCLTQNIKMTNFLNRLEGKISGFRGAYTLCKNKEQLEKILDSGKNKVLKRMFNQLGINYKELTKKHRLFLGLD